MWDSFNGSLIPAHGANSPFIGMSVSPMAMGGVLPGYGGGMIPGLGMAPGLPFDTFTPQAMTPPTSLEHGLLGSHSEHGGHSVGSTVGGVLKVAGMILGAGALVVLGRKIYKSKFASKAIKASAPQ